MSYHVPPAGQVAALDVTLRRFSDAGLEFVGMLNRHTEMYTGGAVMFFVPVERPKPKTHARDRTRSKRWQAGSKRIKKAARLARRQGRRTPFADPWRGWETMGCIDETGGTWAESAGQSDNVSDGR